MRLLNPRHEAFCQSRAAGYNQAESARRAGYPVKSAGANGCRLSTMSFVVDRIREIEAEDSANAPPPPEPKQVDHVSRSWIVSNLVEIVNISVRKTSRDLSNANRALEMLAKMGGYVIERKESKSEITSRSSIMQMNSGDLKQLLDAQLAQLSHSDRQQVLLDIPNAIDIVPESVAAECVSAECVNDIGQMAA